MGARDEALDLLEKILPREHARAYRELFAKKFDAYAHELAEKQRQAADDLDKALGTRTETASTMRATAKLIDPEVTS